MDYNSQWVRIWRREVRLGWPLEDLEDDMGEVEMVAARGHNEVEQRPFGDRERWSRQPGGPQLTESDGDEARR